MTLTLRIENFDRLDDGGPLSVTLGEGSLEVGRDGSMGWTLPDPDRFVSSRHFEVRCEAGAYWLHDVSTNGTYLNGQSARLRSPYRLEAGDKLQVGRYLIAVEFDGAARGGNGAVSQPPGSFGDQGFGGQGFGGQGFGGQAFGRQGLGGQGFGQEAGFGGSGFAAGGGIGEPPAPAAPAGDIWSTGGAAAPSDGFDPRPRPRAATSDFADQHVELPHFAPAAPSQSPFGAPAAPPSREAGPLDPGPLPSGQTPPQGGHVTSPPVESFPQVPRPGGAPAPAAHPGGASDADLLRAICEGAGIAPDSFSRGDPRAVAREIGEALRIASDALSDLLRARTATKRSVRSGSVTMLGPAENNPLKFIPTADERLDAMFGTPRPGFQRGAAAFRGGFEDVKRHQYAVHAAIQPALARLLDDLSPEAVEEKAGPSRLGARKARAWEIFVERWDAKTHPYENGMLDLFQRYFAEAYDKGKGGEG